jgi:hypothetical protein
VPTARSRRPCPNTPRTRRSEPGGRQQRGERTDLYIRERARWQPFLAGQPSREGHEAACCRPLKWSDVASCPALGGSTKLPAAHPQLVRQCSSQPPAQPTIQPRRPGRPVRCRWARRNASHALARARLRCPVIRWARDRGTASPSATCAREPARTPISVPSSLFAGRRMKRVRSRPMWPGPPVGADG